MAEPLKNIYSEKFLEIFCEILKDELVDFDENQFYGQIFSPTWKDLELKQRMTQIARVLKIHLDSNYETAVKQICSIIEKQQRNNSIRFNFEFMFFPEFIQLYGLNDFEVSIAALEKITQYTSCEFVVRHFLNYYPEKMSQQMFDWAKHKHHYVRRLASEGMRTKLPWAIKVNHLSEKPEKILPLLEKLIEDDSEWVRKSVSNSLNDLSKDIPDQVLEFAEKWIKTSENTNKLLKHGLRTLLKQGNVKALELFGLKTDAKIELKDFLLLTPKIKIGDYLKFYYEIENKNQEREYIRLEYRIYFLRENGTLYPKTFKISEKSLLGNEICANHKKHSFKIITTRKYCIGKQKISFIVNGKESSLLDFYLVN